MRCCHASSFEVWGSSSGDLIRLTTRLLRPPSSDYFAHATAAGERPKCAEYPYGPADLLGDGESLFSAIARPGNSGGPIVAHDGRVIGIVFQESSHASSTGPGTDASESDETSSELTAPAPFYRGIPASELMRALDDFGLRQIATFEDPLNL